MAAHQPRLPASEVIRFGLAVFARLGIAVVLGLLIAKSGKLALGWPTASAITYGYGAIALLFGLSFFLKAVPWPEVDFGPERDASDLDEPDASR